MLAIATTLWITLLVLDFQRSHLQQYLLANAPRAMMAPHSAPLVGRATALGLRAIFVVYAGGRTFAARTWATTLGVALVAADAWAQTWPVLVSMGFTREAATLTYAPPSIVTGGLGLLLMGGGLFAAGKSILEGITVEEYLRAGPKSGGRARRRGSDDDTARGHRRRGRYRAFVDGAFAPWPAAVRRCPRRHRGPDGRAGCRGRLREDAGAVGARRERDDGHGGRLIAVALLILALGRLKPQSARPEGFAYAAFASLVAELVLLFFAWRDGWRPVTSDLVPFVSVAPPVLAACAIYAAATTLGNFAGPPDALTLLRKRLRSSALVLGLCAVRLGSPRD